jgi:acetolactate synthase-1/2/3 large subunit
MTNGYTLLAQPRPAQRLVHIYPDPDELNRVYQSDLAICSSLDKFVDGARHSRPAGEVPWRAQRKQARQDFLDFSAAPTKSGNAAVDLTEVVSHLAKTLPPDAVITNGAGNYTVWVHRYYRYRKAKTQLAPVSGAMGYGLPAAIAAKLRHPERTVVCFAGDGCFLMYPQELSTAFQTGAAIIVLIANNGLYGTIRMHQERHHPGRPIGTQIPSVNYVNLAQSFGAYAERVETNSQFPEAFARALATGRPAVLELMTDQLQLTPDMRLPQI